MRLKKKLTYYTFLFYKVFIFYIDALPNREHSSVVQYKITDSWPRNVLDLNKKIL